MAEIFTDKLDLEERVHNTLESHLDYWIETGASEFAILVIRNGYIPQFDSLPSLYMEKNNLSYS